MNMHENGSNRDPHGSYSKPLTMATHTDASVWAAEAEEEKLHKSRS